jgi:hypothetical protein
MSRAGEGHPSPRVPWKVLAWVVATLIAVAGLALAGIQYRESQREPMAQVCARADDVESSLWTILRARIRRLDVSTIDFDALHTEARELNGAANDTDSKLVRRAASTVRQHLELVTSETYEPIAEGVVDTPAADSLLIGGRELGVIRAECRRQGFPISDVPPDLAQ